MRTSSILAVLLLSALGAAVAEDPDVKRSAPELVASRGLPFEQYWVETPDNYVLNVFRIPAPGSPVVFLQHGLLDSADTWLLNSRQASLAYILSDAGFDVWMGNSRGNKYSRNNTKHSPDSIIDRAFWKFSWDEMAQYDLPTQINFALAQTGKSSVVYIGHSQGTTQAFANFASPDKSWYMGNKVSLFIALAPVAYVYNTPSVVIRALAGLNLDKLISFFGVQEFLPTSKFLRWLTPATCSVTPPLCESIIYTFAGLDLGDLDEARLPVYMAHFPSGTSVRDAAHYAQMIRAHTFRMYDHGLVLNLVDYHQTTPPNYSLGAVKHPPVALFHGGQDVLADPADVELMVAGLPSSTVVYKRNWEQYAHLDFVWGEHANVTMYPDVVSLARRYSA